MGALSRTRDAIIIISTIISIVFSFFTFILNYEKKKHEDHAILRNPLIRLACLGLISAPYAAEAVLLYQNVEWAEAEKQLLAASLLALIWAAVCCRKCILVFDVLGLSVTSLVDSAPALAWLLVRYESHLISQVLVGLASVRVAACIILLGISLSRRLCPKESTKAEGDDETTPFLDANNESYGSARPTISSRPASETDGSDGHDENEDSDSDSDDDDDENKPSPDARTSKLRESGSWGTYLQGLKVFIPHLIPKKDLKVQACLAVCVLSLLAKRFLNVMTPRQLGIVGDKLLSPEGPWVDLALYWFMYSIEDDEGLGLIEALAKIPVTQFSYRRLTTAAFAHVMELGMDFHSDRDSAEVMKAVEQGEALTNVLQMAVLEILPTIIDMFVAFITLYATFTYPIALCMVLASFTFLSCEIVTSNMNTESRRKFTKAQREETRVMHQAIQGWATVSSFNMLVFERLRFGSAVDKHLKAKQVWSVRDALTNGLCSALVPVTLIALVSLIIREIRLGNSTPGDFIFFVQYWDHIVWPVRNLSHEYRFLISDLIDAERLLDLLTTKPTVADKQGALELPGTAESSIEFENVGFYYGQERNVIHDVSIAIAPRSTVALVGATGAGKSTLTKLLLRYYDVTSGAIKIDGHDIRDITQRSLRDFFGLVPQNPLLFNDTIMENLRYANLSATDEDIYEACRAASIHDHINSLPKGYNTKVGEQGVKLSGGEVQRLAIARVFLKGAKALILDEATSAVDTGTESAIQVALEWQRPRPTMIVIAHRLSTIVKADQILVVDGGTVVERGSHQELLRLKGRYYALWQKQLGEDDDENKGDNDDLIDM